MPHEPDPTPLIIPVDILLHTDKQPFCGLNVTSLCYEDLDTIEALRHAIQEGELTPEEATNILKGRTI